MELTTTDKEMLRTSVLAAIVQRHPNAVNEAGVKRAAECEVPFHIAITDVQSALEYLRGLGFLEFQFEEMGATKWWTATTKAIQHEERKNP